MECVGCTHPPSDVFLYSLGSCVCVDKLNLQLPLPLPNQSGTILLLATQPELIPAN